MRKKSIAVFLIIALIGGSYLIHVKRKSLITAKENELKTGDFYTVKTGSVTKAISARGYISPLKERDLFFFNPGKIKKLQVKKGERVKADQLIASIYNDFGDNLITKGDTSIYAPFSGLVAEVYVEQGEDVNPAKIVAKIFDDSEYILKLKIDELDINEIKIGQPVHITLDAIPESTLKGEVKDIGLVAINQGGLISFPVTIGIKNSHPSMKPGMSAYARIIIEEAKDALIIPITAISNKKDGAYIAKKVEGNIEEVKIVPGISDDIIVEVLDGLNQGDKIITNYHESITTLKERYEIGRPKAIMFR